MLIAESPPILLQFDWQTASIIGGTIGGAIVGAAKIVVEGAKMVVRQLEANSVATGLRHNENRSDATEARKENRDLSGAILNIQSQTVKTLGELQAEIRSVLVKLGQCEPGSKVHTYPPNPKGKQ